MKDCLNVLYQFNEKYAPYAGVSITSLFYNNQNVKDICVYILGEDLSSASVERLNSLAKRYSRRIVFVPTDELIEMMRKLNMPTYRGSYAANMRLFVNDIVEDSDRLLYLDADTIVCDDLTQMYDSEVATVGMVYDTLGCEHKYDIGLKEDDGYYNSGVILYDLNKWTSGDYTNKIIEHVKHVRAQYPSPDQDLLNVVLQGEITALPFFCNYQPHLSDYSYEEFMKIFNPIPFYSKKEVQDAGDCPVILHAFRYLGEFPWHKNSLHPFCEEFDRYLAMSPWNDYIKEPAEESVTTTIEKIMYRVLPKIVFLYIFRIMHRSFFKKADKMSKNNQINKAM